MNWFFTSDEHYFHKNVIKYSNRPFSSVEEMNGTLINNNNNVVNKNDVVIHCGDFSFASKEKTFREIVSRLNGRHIFLKGDHDKWLGNDKNYSYIWKKKIGDITIFACHYCMKTWWLSHYNSWNLFGHSHGHLNLEGCGKQWDVGVDNNNYSPVSIDQLREIMYNRPDNFNYIGNRRY